MARLKRLPPKVRRIVREGIVNGLTNQEIQAKVKRFAPEEEPPDASELYYYRRSDKVKRALTAHEEETVQLSAVRLSHRIRMLREIEVMLYNRLMGIVPGVEADSESGEIIRQMHSSAIDVEKAAMLTASYLAVNDRIRKEMAAYESSILPLYPAGLLPAATGAPEMAAGGKVSMIAFMAMVNDQMETFLSSNEKEAVAENNAERGGDSDGRTFDAVFESEKSEDGSDG